MSTNESPTTTNAGSMEASGGESRGRSLYIARMYSDLAIVTIKIATPVSIHSTVVRQIEQSEFNTVHPKS